MSMAGRQPQSGGYGGIRKSEPGENHPQHSQQGTQHTHHTRPTSVQQHYSQPSPSQQPHPSPYSSTHATSPVYQSAPHAAQPPPGAQHPPEVAQYYAQPSPYSTPGPTSGYTSAETPEMMAAAQMPRPYPPISYHTPQSNSPASVASPSGHDQHRSLYGQPPSQLPQQPMYYPAQQAQYSSIPPQAAPAPYGQHAQQSHQTITSQPNIMISHTPSAQHQMPQHAAAATQHAQSASAMTASPRTHKEMKPQVPSQLQRPASTPMGTPQQPNQNRTPLATPTGMSPGVNPNAAPGPIPATTPLIVRQDNNGVQWIAFEYSRDRVKMEYIIRCDVESVNTDELPEDFKSENCVYPRAFGPREQYRGNRLAYETDCNTVGWGLAQLNPCLRGKRGLIQRAVDSWRNSNQDLRLRSRRVRRMAKMNMRKTFPSAPHPGHMPGPGGPAGIPTPTAMAPDGPAPIDKPSMPSVGAPMHQTAQDGEEEVGNGDSYVDERHMHHHHQVAAAGGLRGAADVRPSIVMHDYTNNYATSSNASLGGAGMPQAGYGSMETDRSGARDNDEVPSGLFPDMPEVKKRKFILVDDNARGNARLRVRVTLDGVQMKEIPDSFRKSNSVYPRSYFPREMQSPPPSPTGSRFFMDDISDDGVEDTQPTAKTKGGGKVMVKMPLGDGAETELAVPGISRSLRGKEVRLNDLGYRMAWLQSRVFAGRTVFLQRALDCYRNKTRSAVESIMQDVKTVAPHFETRVGKRKWNERFKRRDNREES